MKRYGFTLIELLVVVAIIALLIGILVPTLTKARDRARSTVCLANLKGIGTGLTVYSEENGGAIVPSYNMTTISAGPNDQLDGWAPILDRDRVVAGTREASRNIYYCPSTLDIEGMAGGNTGMDPDKPRGWMDWPSIRVSNAVNSATTIPARGFERIIRVAYWINAENQFGVANPPNRYYTLSTGYPTDAGLRVPKKVTSLKRPGALIALADGVYAGRQEDGRLNGTDGVGNSRVGYRHNGGKSANTAFADGHAEPIYYKDFPRAMGGPFTGTAALTWAENGQISIYSDFSIVMP